MKRAIATNLVVAAVSTAVLAGALLLAASPHVATLLRLAISLPLLYLGYTRWLGVAPMRVGFAVGAACGLKLAVEPLLITLFPAHAIIAPLLGDLAYGPLVTFVMLRTAETRAPAYA